MPNHLPHIALFLRTLGGGGAERVLLNLAQGFIEYGCKVDLVLSAGEGLELWNLPPSIRVIDLKVPRVSASLPKLVQYIRRERPTALIPSLHYANEVALLAKYLSGTPVKVLVPEHNALSIELLKHEKGSRKHLIPLAVRLLYPFADQVIAVSHGVAQDLSEVSGIPKERIQVIYNPVILPHVSELSRQPLEHSWFQPGQPPVILGVGRLEAQKDFAMLIRAFARVRQVRPARLVILGWGPDRPVLEALVENLGLQEDVSFPGFVNNPYAYMARSALFALSSAWEGLPTVLIEAMSLGIPVVSTNCKSGPAEILDDGRYGELVPVGDSEAMAEAIVQGLSETAKIASSTWLDQFTLQSSIEHYLKMVEAHDERNALLPKSLNHYSDLQ